MLHSLEPELLRSFVAVAESRGQSVVSMQIKRLEDALGGRLFTRDSRTVSPTTDGGILLRRARRILARFGETHPRVQVNVVRRSSDELAGCLAEGDVDRALVSQDGAAAGRGAVLVHREPLAWVTSVLHRAHEREPLPLALFDAGRLFRRWAMDVLARAGRPSRIARTSVSVAGIYAALDAGRAVGALLRSNLRPGLRTPTEAEGLPRLPEVGIALAPAGGRGEDPALDRPEDHVLESFRGDVVLGVAA